MEHRVYFGTFVSFSSIVSWNSVKARAIVSYWLSFLSWLKLALNVASWNTPLGSLCCSLLPYIVYSVPLPLLFQCSAYFLPSSTFELPTMLPTHFQHLVSLWVLLLFWPMHYYCMWGGCWMHVSDSRNLEMCWLQWLAFLLWHWPQRFETAKWYLCMERTHYGTRFQLP